MTESYYECFSSDRDAMLNAVGVAMGNTSLAVPFVVFLCLPFIYIILVIIKQVPPPEEYSNEEKDEALQTFATLLLRMRDGKTRGIKSNGVLVQMTKELITAAKEEAGYPDSDDEESDEEEEGNGAHLKAFKTTPSSGIRRQADSDDEESDEEANTKTTVPSPTRKSDAKTRGSKIRRSSVSGQKPGRNPIGRSRMAVFTK